MLSTAAATRSVNEAEPDAPSPVVKDEELDLEKTTVADASRLKEALKAKMLGGAGEDTVAPPPPSRLKIRKFKKSTL